jgi:hypothetical protein
MNVEIGAEAALFPGKEYIIGIVVAVQWAVPWILLYLAIFVELF